MPNEFDYTCLPPLIGWANSVDSAMHDLLLDFERRSCMREGDAGKQGGPANFCAYDRSGYDAHR